MMHGLKEQKRIACGTYGMIHYLILQMLVVLFKTAMTMQLAFIGKTLQKEILVIVIMVRQISDHDLMKLKHVKP